MPRLNGIESSLRILRQGLCNAVVILTMHNEVHVVRKVLEEGIQAYVLKEDATDDRTGK
jgi:DNA-binding NarL/FixJ family response regulator